MKGRGDMCCGSPAASVAGVLFEGELCEGQVHLREAGQGVCGFEHAGEEQAACCCALPLPRCFSSVQQ